MDVDDRFKAYATMAYDLGARHVRFITPNDVKLDPRCYLKCRYGCEEWGRKWTCPSAPGIIPLDEFKAMLDQYHAIMLIHAPTFVLNQEISFAIERQAYYDGHYFAFSLAGCALCEPCMYPEPCPYQYKARPSMQAMGIDVFATAHAQGLPLDTLVGPGDEENWYSLVLIE
jgi:predicted metal-binding protein